MFDYAMQNPAPTLFQIHWASAEGFVLFAGKDIPHRRAILLKENGASEGSVAFDQIRSWEETGCTVTVYRGNIQSQAWLEVFLNILLEHYCSKILNQYGILTGKVMIHAILWKFHTMAVEEGWNVGTQNSELTDATLFPTAREAGDAYKKIIAEAANHVEPVIGHALTWSILSQTFNASRGIYKTIAEVFGLLGAAPA
jgi:hypothetical protein